MVEQPEDLASMLTIGEAAKELGVSVSTLRNWDRKGKLVPIRHPINSYRLYSPRTIDRLKTQRVAESSATYETAGRVESRFDVPFVARLSLAEKQIQQAYRPYIQVHKWFARRPGTLFRGLLLSEFGRRGSLREMFYRSHDLHEHRIFDPFMGGGTAVLEANRVGMNVIGCDINPMAYWIVHQELDDLNLELFQERADEVARRVEERVGKFYRTICAECGRSVPVKYFIWVKKHRCANCGRAFELLPGYLIAKNVRHPNFVLFCPLCRDLFELSQLPERGAQLNCAKCGGTFANKAVARRNRYECPHCSHLGRYPTELADDGPPSHSLIAMEYHCSDCKPEHTGRFFKAVGPDELSAFQAASKQFGDVGEHEFVPTDLIPEGDETSRLHRWGYRRFAELFNRRQLLSLSTLAAEIATVQETPVRHALATAFSDCLRYQNMLARYDTYALKCQDIFSVHGYPVGLVQCENNVLGIDGVGSGGYRQMIAKYAAAKEYCRNPFEKRLRGKRKEKVQIPGEDIAAEFTDELPERNGRAQAWLLCRSSDKVSIAPECVDAVITDPPYYDNVQYAELIDFCYIWLRKLLGDEVDEFACVSTRTDKELTGNETAGRDLAHFTEGLSAAYSAAARTLKRGGLFAFTYHHNDVDAYVPVVVALCDAHLAVTATLPCPAEMGASLHISGTGSSVVDTVFCARRLSETATLDAPLLDLPEKLAGALFEQGRKLLQGDVDVSEGDLRCMALGILAKWTTNRLGGRWDDGASLKEKTELAHDTLSGHVDRVGFENLISSVFGDLQGERSKPRTRGLFD